jgi:hypothetical protein
MGGGSAPVYSTAANRTCSPVLRYLLLLLHDAIGIFGFALTAAWLPPGLAARWLRVGAHLHRGHPDVRRAVELAARCGRSDDFHPTAFRFMTLAEASMAWRAIFRRRLPVDLNHDWPDEPGSVAVGGHYGAGIAVLWSLREAGLRPQFVLHPPNTAQRRRRPLGYLWSLLRFRLVLRLCPDGPLTTPGARAALDASLTARCTTPVVLLDTPSPKAEDGPGWSFQLGECTVPLRGGAREVIQRHRAPVMLFWARTSPQTGRVEIEIQSPGEGALERWPSVLGETLSADLAQWQLWPFIAGSLKR